MSSVKLYIGDIPADLSEEDLRSYFTTVDDSAKFSLIRKQLSSRLNSKGFGFLFVSSKPSAQRLLDTEHYVRGFKLRCEESLTSEVLVLEKDSLRNRRVFIRNIKRGTSEDSIREALSSFGPIESIFIVKAQSTNKARSFGYVTFTWEDTANFWLQKGNVAIGGSKIYIHKFSKDPSSNLLSTETTLPQNSPQVNPLQATTRGPIFGYPFHLSREADRTRSHIQDLGLGNFSEFGTVPNRFHETVSHTAKPTQSGYFKQVSTARLDHSLSNIVLKVTMVRLSA